ncbi:MAG TPA: ABC-2 family transporter protein [Acidimicrobiales bacterium]|nr:ABC-2 family transporter protein [Acidimicrobiales bacterium]
MIVRALRISAATAARRTMAEPGGLFVTVFFYLAVVSVLSTLWRTATQANGGTVAGYTAVALTWYVATSEAATVTMNTRLIEETGEDIASGAIAVELLRPISVLGLRVATELGRCLPRLAICGAIGVAYACVLGGAPPRPLGLLLAAPSLVLAIACNLVAQHAFAAASFWIRDARSTWFLYQKLVFIVGGMLLPLEVLPAVMREIALRLPFMAMAYAPSRLASGHVEPWLLLVQAFWFVVLSALAVGVFARGERRLQVVGG